MSKKRAMVAPKPKQPIQTEMQGTDISLASVLQQLGNDRSYTIIRSHGNTWRVIFEGDLLPSTVKLVSNHWAIVPD